MPDSNPGLMTVFTDALERTDPAERAAYLDAACAGDDALRRRVEELLAAHPAVGRFLEPAAANTLTADGRTADVLPAETQTGTHHPGGGTGTFGDAPPRPGGASAVGLGTVIGGRYTLAEVIGEGGMGSIYLASQTDPVKRQVALKLIKSGMDSKAVLARFDAERQALALMEHPNIARIYDGGVTDRGRPFFVMELVPGVPLTEYCDAHRLTVDARLQLFVQVCQAVQHAHQKGIIHRDLKPSNVLVTEVDGRPTPKVIDFGVAKATEQKLTDMSFSDTGAIVGTPAYMSPEQADPGSMDIDTRTDVYALGVMLYELLTGSPPIDTKQFKRGAILEMLRMVREFQPPRPSTKLSTSEALPNIAVNRGTEPAKLAKLLRGELDWVVMKAVEKDRTRRYESAYGLARDIQRYLADEIVEARPPSAGYRLKKFVRRHKGQVIAASLVLFALVAGAVGTTIGLFEAKKQERFAVAAADEERKAKEQAEVEKANAVKAAEAEIAAKLVAEAKRREAERNLAFATKGNEILGSVFGGLDPKANYATVGELSEALRTNLRKAVAELDGSAIGDPLVVSAMQDTLGRSLLGLGDAPAAVTVFEKALATLKVTLGPNHSDTLAGMGNLALGYQAAGRLDLALPLFEETLRRQKATLGPNHPDTLAPMNNLALGYQAAGKLDLALPLLEETLKRQKARFGPDHLHTLRSIGNLAMGYKDAGRLDLALPLFEEALTRTKASFGPNHPDTLRSMGNLAMGYKNAGILDRAVPLLEETFKRMKATLGPDHPSTLHSMSYLGMGYQAAGKFDLALPLLEEALKRRKATVDPDHPDILHNMGSLAVGYQEAGQLDLALPLLEETLRLQKAKLGPDHPGTLLIMGNLAACYWSLRRLDKSVPLFEELLPRQERKLGRGHPDTLLTVANLGVNYKDIGRLAEAIPLLEEAHRASKKYPPLRFAGLQLPDAYAKAGRPVEAAKLIDEVLTDIRKQLPKDSPQLAGQLAQFSMTLLEMKGATQAESLLRECLSIREKTQPDEWTTFNTQSMLGGALLGQQKYADAEPLLLKGYEGMKQREKTIPPQGGTRIPEALDRLVDLNTATDKPDEAKKWRAERAKYPPAPLPMAPPPREKK